MPMGHEPIAPPPIGYLALEGRAGLEFSMHLAALPLLRFTPKGDGHPVLVLPGFTASDVSTLALRRFLRSRGYHAHGWRLGRNLGPSTRVVTGLGERFTALREKHGRKVSLVGWSLGGIYARELARLFPNDVRQVITLASPFRDPLANNVIVPPTASSKLDEDPDLYSRLRAPLEVPTTAVYTRTDGIVAWKSCVEEEGPYRENIEVWSSHCGIGHHPMAMQIIANRLAQPEGEWRRYRGPGSRS